MAERITIRDKVPCEGYNIFYAGGENVEEALGMLQNKIRQAQETFNIVCAHGGPNWKQDDLVKTYYIAIQALTLQLKA